MSLISSASRVDLPDPGLPVIRILGFVRFLIPKLNWFAMRRVPVGVGPGFFTLEKRGRIGQTLCRDKSFESGQPMLVITRAIIGITAICGGFKLIGKSCRPFFPTKVTSLGKLDSERERLCLPRLGEHRSALVTGQIG